MSRFLALLYGAVCYVISMLTILYLVVFLAFFVVPEKYQQDLYQRCHWSCDHFASDSPGNAMWIDLGLLALFGVQHSVMARPGFKRLWTRVVPQPIERSTYCLIAAACLWLLFWQWKPIVEPIWGQEDGPLATANTTLRPAFQTAYWLGFALAVASTFLVDHWGLFGLRQTVAYFRGQETPAPCFRTPLFYRYVRHPLMLGFLLAFWATPVLTLGRAIFAGGMTLYILIAIWFEERDLAAHFGEPYVQWKAGTSMLLPLRRPK